MIEERVSEYSNYGNSTNDSCREISDDEDDEITENTGVKVKNKYKSTKKKTVTSYIQKWLKTMTII